uniref:CD44 antigen isoform X1 n=1 Tax=Myodes glareolus TaxID=447135 RepID=UPI00202136B3|nr:CD44 antigen isoform X1 [Myodes glareolus]
MDMCWWHAAWGLCLLQLSLAQQQIDLNITCRYAGVFHVEKNGRYSISRTEAADLCQAFNSTLPTMNQMLKALEANFETCRYGFIQDNVVIPRITPNAICAANNTGVYILQSNTSHYDTYCFNASAPPGEDCTSVTDLPNSFDGPVTITIVNRDGTRYSKKGEYRTHQEDIDASHIIDEDVSSGSSSEKSTSGGYIFHTFLPTEHPTGDEDESDFTRSTPTTIASTVHSNSHAATQKQNNWMWFWFGNSQSTTQTQEPTTTSTAVSSTPRVSDHPIQNQDWTQWKPSHSNPEVLLQTTTRMTDVDKNSTVAHGENSTQEPQPPVNHHEYQDEEETPHATSTKGRDSSTDPRHGSNTETYGSGSAGHASGSQDGGANTTPLPGRRPQIPEWLIILASLLALALILAVCIAVNSRRRCGQKKKLVINSGNGKVEDRKPSELNGEASKSQEMVHLVNKEPSETPDQFMTTDETRNLQNVDMKIGV